MCRCRIHHQSSDSRFFLVVLLARANQNIFARSARLRRARFHHSARARLAFRSFPKRKTRAFQFFGISGSQPFSPFSHLFFIASSLARAPCGRARRWLRRLHFYLVYEVVRTHIRTAECLVWCQPRLPIPSLLGLVALLRLTPKESPAT